MISKFISDRKLEVLIFIEGSDSSTGNIVQARHSYSVDDIVWDHFFETCVFEDQDGAALIDFRKFHTLKPVSFNSSYSGPVPSQV